MSRAAARFEQLVARKHTLRGAQEGQQQEYALLVRSTDSPHGLFSGACRCSSSRRTCTCDALAAARPRLPSVRRERLERARLALLKGS